jgi:hypothetical protein
MSDERKPSQCHAGAQIPEILLVTQSGALHADLIEAHLKRTESQYLLLNTDEILKDVDLVASFDGTERSVEIKENGRTITLNSIRSIWWFGVEPPKMASRSTSIDKTPANGRGRQDRIQGSGDAYISFTQRDPRLSFRGWSVGI